MLRGYEIYLGYFGDKVFVILLLNIVRMIVGEMFLKSWIEI